MRKLMIGTILASLLAVPAVAQETPLEDTKQNWSDCSSKVYSTYYLGDPNDKEAKAAFYESWFPKHDACKSTFPKGFAEYMAEPAPSELATLMREARQEFRNESARINREYNLRKSGLLPY